MKVEYREAGQFWVQSEKDHRDGYLVDLLSKRPHGECGCPHYQYRIQSLRRGAEVNGPIRCKHIAAAMEACANLFLNVIQEARARGAEANKKKITKDGDTGEALQNRHQEAQERAPHLRAVPQRHEH